MTLLPAAPQMLPLYPNGPMIGSIAWGMWRLTGSPAEAAVLVRTALDAGINLLDTADIYGFDGSDGFGEAEKLLGEVFSSEPGFETGQLSRQRAAFGRPSLTIRAKPI